MGTATVGADAAPRMCKLTAIVRGSALERVEGRLKDLRVPGMTVTQVKGYGESANYYRTDWTVAHARIEIFLAAERADEVARAIIEVAATGAEGDGLVAILPVEALYRVRTGRAPGQSR